MQFFKTLRQFGEEEVTIIIKRQNKDTLQLGEMCSCIACWNKALTRMKRMPLIDTTMGEVTLLFESEATSLSEVLDARFKHIAWCQWFFSVEKDYLL